MVGRMLLGLSCLIPLVATPNTSRAQSWHSYAFGKEYTVTIPRKTLEASPDWKETDEHPPLSARKAIELGTKLKDKLVKDSDDFKWKVERASLEPDADGKWYWVIHFAAGLQGAGKARPHNLRLVVLMDGTVLEPTVGDQP